MNAWPRVPLGEILVQHSDWIELDPGCEYKQVTARLWGKGLALRGVVKGAGVAAKAQNRVKANQFLISKIDARHGAFGVVSDELDGAIVSSDFPTFDVDRERMLPHFLSWISKTEWFVALCRRASEGSTNRVRLKEGRFLNQQVPLPPLADQRQIVTRLDTAAAKLQARQKSANRTEVELAMMLRAAFEHIVAGAPMVQMGEVAPIHRRPVEIDLDQTYAELGVRSFGRGLFDKPVLRGSDLTWQKLFRVEENDIVFSNIKAWEGAFAVTRKRHHGMVGSHRYVTCVANSERITPDFLWYFLQSAAGILQIQVASPGSADRNRTLNQKALEAIKAPCPSLGAQRWFNRLQEKAVDIRVAHAAAAEEADRLLPSLLDRAFPSPA